MKIHNSRNSGTWFINAWKLGFDLQKVEKMPLKAVFFNEIIENTPFF